MNLPRTAKEALLLGVVHYFTGVPCKNGHLDRRHANGRKCVSCNREIQARFSETPSGRAYHRAKANANFPRHSKINRKNLSEVQKFYLNCPPGYEVDHIIPKHSGFVCGFDTLLNLQYLPREENRKKSNKIDPFALEFNVCVLPEYREYVCVNEIVV